MQDNDRDDRSPELRFQDSLREGRFELQVCDVTGKAVFYPRMVSPHSGKPLTAWQDVSGLGTVYATTVIRRKPERGGDLNIVLVDLDEGARMMSAVRGCEPGEVRIGMRVAAEIEEDADGEPLVFFRPGSGETT